MNFINELKFRNETLFYFSAVCLAFSIIFLILTLTKSTQINNVNAWYKPFKFAFSTVLFSSAMAWYCYYLPSFNIKFFNWSVIVLLGFEIVYIAIKAGMGRMSHYDLSSPFYSIMYSLMALAASLVTIYTAYVGYLFFVNKFPELPTYYVWGIRLGIIIFVVFSFQGFAMGSRLSHTVGGADGSPGWYLVNWSKTLGDLRVAHFLGMHALQLLPLLSFYVIKNTKATFVVALVYAAITTFTLVQALKGKPLVKSATQQKG